MDDDRKVLDAIRRTLSSHEVTVVDSGEEALRILQRQEFHVVLCDLMMPGCSGQELYGRVKERRPELLDRIVFMTGGAFTPGSQAFIASIPNLVVSKPLERARLEEVLREARGRALEPMPSG